MPISPSADPTGWSKAAPGSAISAPAFGGSSQKISAELAAISPTSRKPGGKSDAMIVACALQPHHHLHRERADRDAGRERHLLADRGERGGAAHARRGTSA